MLRFMICLHRRRKMKRYCLLQCERRITKHRLLIIKDTFDTSVALYRFRITGQFVRSVTRAALRPNYVGIVGQNFLLRFNIHCDLCVCS